MRIMPIVNVDMPEQLKSEAAKRAKREHMSLRAWVLKQIEDILRASKKSVA